MDSTLLQVVLQKCTRYDRAVICELFDETVKNLNFEHRFSGAVVLLKPNLISASGENFSCTHKEFIAGVAAWFTDQGAKVQIGDSPAIGSGPSVCARRGITGALEGMGVKQVDFTDAVRTKLAGGVSVNVARPALECDYLVNLAKVKAHKQMYVTLAVKNIFGIVKGVNKGMLHMTQGSSHTRFSEIILDLLALLPPSLHFLDGIVAMHRSGPLDGIPLQLNMIGGATCPVALDATVLEALELNKNKSPLWRVARTRGLAGCDLDNIEYPVLLPASFSGSNFEVPEDLHAVRFNPLGFFSSMVKKTVASFGN